MAEDKHTCVKCGKEKAASEMHIFEGQKYCCDICCGDVTRGEHKQKAHVACEFC